MSLDKDTVAHIARLARIRLTPEEAERLSGELSGILTWIEQLDQVETADIPPITTPLAESLEDQEDLALRLREDKVTDGGQSAAVIGNAPESAHGFFVVPKVIE